MKKFILFIFLLNPQQLISTQADTKTGEEYSLTQVVGVAHNVTLQQKNAFFLASARQRNRTHATFWLKQGAQINARDTNIGWTALMHATFNGDVEFATMLLNDPVLVDITATACRKAYNGVKLMSNKREKLKVSYCGCPGYSALDIAQMPHESECVRSGRNQIKALMEKYLNAKKPQLKSEPNQTPKTFLAFLLNASFNNWKELHNNKKMPCVAYIQVDDNF